MVDIMTRLIRSLSAHFQRNGAYVEMPYSCLYTCSLGNNSPNSLLSNVWLSLQHYNPEKSEESTSDEIQSDDFPPVGFFELFQWVSLILPPSTSSSFSTACEIAINVIGIIAAAAAGAAQVSYQLQQYLQMTQSIVSLWWHFYLAVLRKISSVFREFWTIPLGRATFLPLLMPFVTISLSMRAIWPMSVRLRLDDLVPLFLSIYQEWAYLSAPMFLCMVECTQVKSMQKEFVSTIYKQCCARTSPTSTRLEQEKLPPVSRPTPARILCL